MPQDESRQAGRTLDYWNEHTKAGYAKAADGMKLPRRWLAVRVPPGERREYVVKRKRKLEELAAEWRHELERDGGPYDTLESRCVAQGWVDLYDWQAALLTEALEAMGEGEKDDQVR